MKNMSHTVGLTLNDMKRMTESSIERYRCVKIWNIFGHENGVWTYETLLKWSFQNETKTIGNQKGEISKMIYQFCFILLFLTTNADLLWWNRNRNNDLFPGVSVGKRFHSLHWRTSWLAITWFFYHRALKLSMLGNWVL